ncbi:ABC transporter permease [Streptomyces malaysiensis subsp. malaysiensis]|nr:Putative aliphatic sulfonates transport permease protein SsuC [Streptomyces sp. M56]MCC4318943.1 ABC transporter permease [Streptomyces malaysiensis]MCD9594053.1 ABC transporter permease [Streptomyces sp. 8ZJF_21]UHH18161.1 ABC transporter permease [Streptomyces sp. HNM0561]SCG11568.1 NitT/TauT family transport system permease protein [Streptomyces sp. MnatMP-M27]
MTAAASGGALADRRRTLFRGVLPPLVFGLSLLVVWDIVTRTGAVAEFYLPAPLDLARHFLDDVFHGDLVDYTEETVWEALAGSGIGIGVALPLGYLIARSEIAAAALQPYVAASQAMPAVALAPLLALWIGYGLLPIAVLCALLVFFPIIVNTVLGLRSLDPDVMGAARVDGVGWWGMLWYIELPLALPSVLAGVRNGLTLSITGAVVGEFVMGGDGLGQLLSVQRQEADTIGLFSTLVMLGLLAAVLYGVVRLVERLVQRD